MKLKKVFLKALGITAKEVRDPQTNEVKLEKKTYLPNGDYVKGDVRKNVSSTPFSEESIYTNTATKSRRKSKYPDGYKFKVYFDTSPRSGLPEAEMEMLTVEQIDNLPPHRKPVVLMVCDQMDVEVR